MSCYETIVRGAKARPRLAEASDVAEAAEASDAIPPVGMSQVLLNVYVPAVGRDAVQ